MANVAKINGVSLGFQTGGSFVVGGSGAPDSQHIAFRASPGEQVSITKPNQVKKGDQNTEEGTSASSNGGVRIINVIDPGMVESFLSSSSGERVIMNVIESNKNGVKAVLE